MWNDGIVTPHSPDRRALEEVSSALRAHGDDFQVVQSIPLDHAKAYEISMGLYFEDGGRPTKKVLEDGGEIPSPLPQSKLKADKNEYLQQHNEHWLRTADPDGQPFDAILCPVGPSAAPPLGTSTYWPYTSQRSLLEYPGASFPVTTVDPMKDVKDCGYIPKSPRDKHNHDQYDPKTYVDAPIRLQAITRKLEDEKCLVILEAIEKVMGR